MDKLVVMVDVDGVLANWNAGMVQLARSLYDVELPAHPREVQTWTQVSDLLGPERWEVIWGVCTGNPNFAASLPPLASAHEFALLESLNLVADVYFVTHRGSFGAKVITEHWLQAQGISHPTVVLSAQKGLICKAINATHAIEDSPSNLVDIVEQSPMTRSYLVEYPYNACAAHRADRVVKSVKEFAREVLATPRHR